jgi:hypothetical protein
MVMYWHGNVKICFGVGTHLWFLRPISIRSISRFFPPVEVEVDDEKFEEQWIVLGQHLPLRGCIKFICDSERVFFSYC